MITLAEAKAYMGITSNTDDLLIQSYIDDVTAVIEELCNNIFVQRTFTDQSIDTFNIDGYDGRREVVLAGFPISAVSVKYDGTSLVSDNEYIVNTASGTLYWPSYPSSSFSDYTITYTAGYAIEDVPRALKVVAKTAVKSMYESNSSSSKGSSSTKSKRIGDFSVTYGASGVDGDPSSALDSVLSKNKRILMGYTRILI